MSEKCELTPDMSWCPVVAALLLLALAACSSPCDSSDVSFCGHWEDGVIGNGSWYDTHVAADDRVQQVNSPVRQRDYAGRVEVRPGDKWMGTSGERAEVVHMTQESGAIILENATSGTQFYAFSVQLDPSWQSPLGTEDTAELATCPVRHAWGIILQLHGPDELQGPTGPFSTSPAFAFNVTDPSAPGVFSVTTNAGPLDPSNPYNTQNFMLSEEGLNRGSWVDFIVEINWAADSSGRINVWRRDEGETEFAEVLSEQGVPTLQYAAGSNVENHYWKHGFYRADCDITNVLWVDAMTRGNTFEAVRDAAFDP